MRAIINACASTPGAGVNVMPLMAPPARVSPNLVSAFGGRPRGLPPGLAVRDDDEEDDEDEDDAVLAAAAAAVAACSRWMICSACASAFSFICFSLRTYVHAMDHEYVPAHEINGM